MSSIGKEIRFWLLKHFGGSFHFYIFSHRITIHGFSAMQVAIDIHTQKWGYICFHPSLPGLVKMRWYFYISPNGTPWGSTFAVGPGISKVDKIESKLRREKFGHNFDIWNKEYEEYHFWNTEYQDYRIN